MKTLTFASFVAASLFALDVHASISADLAFERPQVALAADTAALLGRVEHALLQYAKNCETGDHATISQALTDTAVIEYVTAQPERVVSVDAAAAQNCWEEATLLRHAANLHVWIFPTSYANTVFVQYETADGAASAKESAEHLAMIEMDGLRIARIRDLTTDATIKPLATRILSERDPGIASRARSTDSRSERPFQLLPRLASSAKTGSD